jgi:hypothetical protein
MRTGKKLDLTLLPHFLITKKCQYVGNVLTKSM